MQSNRPPKRWHHAEVTLRDFGIVTWRTDPAVLNSLLPDGWTADLRDGGAFVSMVAFRDDRFRFRGVPVITMSCGQVNYRAYVRRGDETGVWFFGFSLDSPLAAIPRLVWKMPWNRTHLDIAIEPVAHTPAESVWTVRATGAWGVATITARIGGDPVESLPGFDGPVTSEILHDPFVGWYQRRNRPDVGRYTVWHEPLELVSACAETARCSVFENLGLVSADQHPVQVGVTRSTRFDVHTPPRTVL